MPIVIRLNLYCERCLRCLYHAQREVGADLSHNHQGHRVAADPRGGALGAVDDEEDGEPPQAVRAEESAAENAQETGEAANS